MARCTDTNRLSSLIAFALLVATPSPLLADGAPPSLPSFFDSLPIPAAPVIHSSDQEALPKPNKAPAETGIDRLSKAVKEAAHAFDGAEASTTSSPPSPPPKTTARHGPTDSADPNRPRNAFDAYEDSYRGNRPNRLIIDVVKARKFQLASRTVATIFNVDSDVAATLKIRFPPRKGRRDNHEMRAPVPGRGAFLPADPPKHPD